MKEKLLGAGEGSRVTREPAEQTELKVGTWWWAKGKSWDDKSERDYLWCLTKLGSNYALLESAGEHHMTWRVHFDEFDSTCIAAPEAEQVIAREVESRRQQVVLLLGEVQAVTARLALDAGSGGETQALAVGSGTGSLKTYETALVTAKDKTLPELFKQIKQQNEEMAKWMQANLLPLEAAEGQLAPMKKKIEARIFNVKLYAGLIEEVVQVKDGAAADATEPIHLYQRRAYMDEECLARYQKGGMEFKDIEDFDRWFARPENLERLMPHARGVLAMRVRRYDKERDLSIADFIAFGMELRELDKLTFLYIRNGQQVHRLSTGIEFEHHLFPDQQAANFSDEMYAEIGSYNKVEQLITKAHYDDLRARHKEDMKQWRKADAAYKQRRAELKARGITDSHHKGWPNDLHWWGPDRPADPVKDMKRFSPESVYYDEIRAHIAKEVDAQNRLVLVLQGLLDRSDVFKPHPRYQLWEPGDFQKALVLVYDAVRTLVPGEAPDFEVYRSQLNRGLKAGSVCVGQEDYWEEREAEKENERQRRDWRIRNKSDYQRYRPSGNPGPGTLAKAERVTKTTATFRWRRERQRDRWNDTDPWIEATVTAPVGRLLNVDAYTPGDFHLFFDDPRTRADYLQWAPYLLEAEEYHAGNRVLRPVHTRVKSVEGGCSMSSFQPGSRYAPGAKWRKG
jgi:hypothetical protein